MIHISDLGVEGSTYEISLSKLITKPIKDVYGYLTGEFGGVTFEMTKIVFDDGTILGCEGEHDCPYLVVWDTEQPNFDEETPERLYEEANN